MPKFVRQAKCVNGKRAMCVTKYETMCTNKEVTHEMTEDYPRWVYSQVTNMICSQMLMIQSWCPYYAHLLFRCRVEMMKKCSNKSQNLQHILFGSKGNNNCHKVPAMRCRIEKRKVNWEIISSIHFYLIFIKIAIVRPTVFYSFMFYY